MFDFNFHRLPLAVALAVSLTFGYGIAMGVRGLSHVPDIKRSAEMRASIFLARLRVADGVTDWTQ